MSVVGKRIKDLRKGKSLTQGQLGKIVDVSATAIMRYEQGNREPRIEQLQKIAEALEVSTLYLLGETDNPNPIDLEKIAKRAQVLKVENDLKHGIRLLSIPDTELQYGVEAAEAALLSEVHSVCGMDEEKISEDFVSGVLSEKWNPRKIDIVREYIHDSRAVLEKLIANSELSTDGAKK